MFGNYFQIELLNEVLYDRILKKDLGYQPFGKNALINEENVRQEDGETYVKIFKTQGIKVRLEGEQDWIKKLVTNNDV